MRLRVQGVSKHFGGILALNDISLDVSENEILGIIGPNGAGKTTLFNVITGTFHADQGRITYGDNDITHLKPNHICCLGIVKTFQNIRLFRSLNVFENVWLGQNWYAPHGLASIFLLYSRREKKLRERIHEILEFMGLGDKRNIPVSSLAYGDRRKVEIAMALASEAGLILLDEPAAGMNPVETTGLMEKIAQVRREMGKTILIIEHDMSVIMNLSDRVIVINFGQKIAEGLPAEIQRNPRVIEAYLGRE